MPTTPSVGASTPSSTAESNITEAPAPRVDLQPVSYSSYADSAGALWVVGEVGNLGPAAVQNVHITISLVDNNGTAIAAGYATVRYIPAGSKFPFQGLIPDPPGQPAHIVFQIQGSPYNESALPIYTDLVVNQVTGKNSASGYDLHGQLFNVGPKKATSVEVVAVACDSVGKVIDVGSTSNALSDILARGNSPFSLEFRHLSEAPSSYWVYVVSLAK